MSHTAKRIRAIIIALAITAATNYAISYAAGGNGKSSTTDVQQTSTGLRSGNNTGNPVMPKP